MATDMVNDAVIDTVSYAGAKAVLDKYGLTPSKRFGQNFLIDRHVLKKIMAACALQATDFVLEIGAGIGGLTAELARQAGKVCAVELDKRLVAALSEIFAEYNNVDIIQNDVLKLDLKEIIAANADKRCVIAANLPYYITTPVIMKVLESRLPVARAVFMVQKEVAARLCAKAGGSDYGALSAAVSYYAKCEICAIVPRNCFMPRPEVDSAVVALDIYEKPPVNVADEGFLFACVKAAFGQRRKTLVNCLNTMGMDITKEELAKILSSIGLREDARGETLGIAEFAALADALKEYTDKK